jgi:hypothetical protein
MQYPSSEAQTIEKLSDTVDIKALKKLRSQQMYPGLHLGVSYV